MTTFARRTLQQRITDALTGLRRARQEHDVDHELGAEDLMNSLIGRLPRGEK